MLMGEHFSMQKITKNIDKNHLHSVAHCLIAVFPLPFPHVIYYDI